MGEIKRLDVNENWAHSGIVQAGDFCFLNYCVGNVGGSIEDQINGAFNQMEMRLALVGLTLENVVQMDCLFRDVWNIPIRKKLLKSDLKENIRLVNPSRRILRMTVVNRVFTFRWMRSRIA